MLGYTKRRQGVVSKPVIFHILHGGRPECEQPADFKSIEVMMCQIGSALRPRQMEIGRIINAGYFMEAPTRAALTALMEVHRGSAGRDGTGCMKLADDVLEISGDAARASR